MQQARCLTIVLIATIVFSVTSCSNPPALLTEAPLEFSGTIEAKQVAVAIEVGGQVRTLAVREGDAVAAGAVLAQLDTAFLDAQIARAQAGVDAARANLAQVKAGARAEQVEQARAALAKAIAARDGAAQALKNVQAMRDNPQELDAQIAQARAQLEAAQAAVVQAENQVKAARIARDRYQGATSLEDRAAFRIADSQTRAAEAGVQAARAARDGAQVALDLLLAMRANPIQLNAQLHAAQAGYAQAVAAVEIAQANLDKVLAGATKEQIAIAEAQVLQAEAVLEQLQVQRNKMTVRAPSAGIVTALPVRIGENVQPGTTLLTLANLDTVHLTLYVPETQIGRVKVGQRARVTVDGLPGRSFDGQVYFIASQPEFTPTTVQTKEERAKTVFMVKVRLANPDHVLKPGMPADAVM
ncbi:MAG: efflux RND transporter periplasmic adaptor subunit [Anaerolineae bacterium]|nr:efflux RND transporter periplasmic adaptor subunit [Anaerolineae bacterium]